MDFVKETYLPGIGKKFTMEFLSKEKMIIVVHDDGKRELYSYGITENDEYTLIAEMTDVEARRLSGILGGIYYQPTAMEDADLTLHDMCIQWHPVSDKSSLCHKSINELAIRKTWGISVIGAIQKDGTHKINPGPDFVIEAGQTLVVVGERDQVKVFKKLVLGEHPHA